MSLILLRLTISLFIPLTLLLPPYVRAFPPLHLAVRSPYLNCWLPAGDGNPASHTWPTTFNRNQNLGWTVLVRVDNLTYSLLGGANSSLINDTINGFAVIYYFSMISITGNAGPMYFNLNFLNPFEIDRVKLSIPFSYMAFAANSTDGVPHAVQVYSDITGEWSSRDASQRILWSPSSNSDVVFHNVTLQTPAEFTEISDQAQWGTLYFAMKAGTNVTYQAASDVDSRGNFTHNGKLQDRKDPNLSLLSDSHNVFAISRDLGTIQVMQDPVIWAIGHTTDFAINYTDLSGARPTSRIPYYKVRYSDDEELASIDSYSWEIMSNIKAQISDFLNGFSDALSRQVQIDDNITRDSNSISTDLSGLPYFAISEVYGSMQLTVGTDKHGNINESDVMMFMKNIGGAQKNRVNAVETLYSAFPTLMYIDPSLGGPLLEPLFRLQASRNYTIGYAAADIGSNYPSVSGINSNHSQGVEQTGNMLIMTYAYARASGDGSFISRYYSLLTSWAEYLNASTLFITNQSSADNLTINNQTNLAIKGIIAIKAMSKMSRAANQRDDETKFSDAATTLYNQWENLALSSDQANQHLLAVYGKSDSWTLGYNLFADVWLDTGMVEPSVIANHSAYLNGLMQNSTFSTFGMPVDSENTNIAVSSWSLFVAAMTKNSDLRSGLIRRVNNRSISTFSGVFPVYFDSTNGTSLRGIASPAQGAMLAPVVLNAPTQTINLNGTIPKTNIPSPEKRNRNEGAIIGGVAAIFAVIGIVAFIQRRRKRRRSRPRSILTSSNDSWDAGLQMIMTPFDPNSETTQDSGILAEQQPMISGNTGAEMVTHHHLSSLSPSLLSLPRPGAPALDGLSDKEIARLRVLSSQQSHNHPTSSETRSGFSPNVVTEFGEASLPHDTRRLQLEVESLRWEIERLRADELIGSAPPSYTEGDG